MIQFLSPAWLLLGLLAVPILAMYMLKLRRRSIQVSSTMLWQELLRDRQANTPWQRLKRNILLILQMITLFSLVLALVRPAFAVASLASGSTIILLDASASMAATDVKPNRFEAAREIVEEMIARVESNNQMTIIQVTRQPEVLANAEFDRDKLFQGLQRATVSQGSADWSTAFALAIGAVSALPQNQPISILIVSDGGLPAKDLPPLPTQVRYIPIGQSSENLAITAFSLRPFGNTLELFASVKNYGDSDHATLLSIELNGVLSFSKEIYLPAGQSQDLVLKDMPITTRIARAYLGPASEANAYSDMLELDNNAYAVNTSPAQRDIYLLTSDYFNQGDENQFLISILGALGLSAKRPILDRQTTPRVMPVIPKEISNLYIFDGIFPLDPETRSPALPREGNLLLINPPEISIKGVITTTSTITPGISTFVSSDPLTEFLNWDAIYVSRTKVIEAGPWAKILVRSGNIPLVMAGEFKSQRIAVIGFNLHDSDFPLQIAYPVLMSSLFNFLLPPQAVQTTDQGLQAGDSVEIKLSPELREILIGKPDQSFIQVPTNQLSMEFGDTSELGVYAVNLLGNNTSQDRTEYFAVNLFDPIESQISPSPVINIGQATLVASRKDAINKQEIWPWCVLLAFIVLCAEWEIYHRRLTQAISFYFSQSEKLKNLF